MRYSWLAIGALVLVLSACASSKQLKESVATNSGRIEMLQQQSSVLGSRLENIDASIRQIVEKIASFDRKLNAIAVDLAKGELGELKEEVSDIEQRLTELENEGRLAPASAMELSADAVSIKVLSGTGNIGSARMLAQRLSNDGYEVKRVDMAPTHFSRNTVFYSEGSHDVAMEIAGSIGPGTAVRPLTWSSTFNIIAVTVE